MLPGTLSANGATFTSSGVNAPSSEQGANGVWWGCTMKRSGGGIYYCVWQEAPANTFALRWNGPADEHRATMQESGGLLIVTTYLGSGDGKPTERIAVPGFVPLASAPGPAGPAGGGGGLTMEQESDLAWLAGWRALLSGA